MGKRAGEPARRTDVLPVVWRSLALFTLLGTRSRPGSSASFLPTFDFHTPHLVSATHVSPPNRHPRCARRVHRSKVATESLSRQGDKLLQIAAQVEVPKVAMIFNSMGATNSGRRATRARSSRAPRPQVLSNYWSPLRYTWPHYACGIQEAAWI